jgi:hypothetical protein
VAALTDYGRIRSRTAGGNYNITSSGAVFAEDQGIASEAQIEACRSLRPRLLTVLGDVYEHDGPHNVEHFETLAAATTSDTHFVVENLKVLTDLGYVETRHPGSFKLTRRGIDAVTQKLPLQGVSPIVELERESVTQGSADPIPPELQRSLEQFRRDHPDPSKAAFIMMRFGSTQAHQTITDAIRSTLQGLGIKGLRADDKEYHDDLYWNIMTYIYGCSFGVAVFERIEMEDFNPNVSYEVGYMNALNRPVCLLKDRTLRTLQTDLVGKLYRAFDPQDPAKAIKAQLPKWIADHSLG